MLRSRAWLFLDIGRRLERGQLLSTLLRAVVVTASDAETESVLLDALLTTTESAMAYRRGYHDDVRCGPVLALLVLDESNPRSLAFQLRTLQGHVELLPHEEGARRGSDQALLVQDAVARLRMADLAALERVDDNGQRLGLTSLLGGFDQLLREVAISLARDYFTDVGGAQQLIGSGWEGRA